MKVFILSGILITLSCFSYAQESQPDSVTITFEVLVPESTPDDATIFWTGSLNNWDPGYDGSGFSAKELAKPLNTKSGKQLITITSVVDDTIEYKYTRGSIFSVEEKYDFTYRPVRKVVFTSPKTVRDTVAAWHDRPPEALDDNWPVLELAKSSNIVASGKHIIEGNGQLIYDKAIGSRFFSVDSFHTKTKGIPKNIGEHVFYFIKISDAPDNTVIVMAGKPSKNSPWDLYIDKNNDDGISSNEYVFTANTDTIKSKWSGDVEIEVVEDGSITSHTINFTLTHVIDAQGYQVSINSEAPILTYGIPLKQRKTAFKKEYFYLMTSFENKFSKYFNLTVDRNKNDTLEVGSGSNELSEIDFTEMYRQKKYYIHPIFQLGDEFWEVADIDPEGTSIRLRPANNARSKENITKGKATPSWKATTVEDKKISSSSLQGKYVLLDFWGSWCGPCIQEIPLLQKVYKRFKSDKFEIVGFAYESKASLNRALKNYELPWVHILDDKGDYASSFLVRGYPTHYLIGPDGSVLETGYDIRGEKLIETLEKYLE